VHTHASIVAGPRYRLRNFLERPDTLMMPAQPQSHLGFIVYGTYAVLAGVPLVPLYDPSGHELARAIETHRPTTVMAFAHAYAELAALEVPEGALDSVTGWITMGDAIHEAHIKAILGKRSPDLPPAVFFDRFGTTELGWGLIVQPRTLASKRNDRCVGKPDPVAEVAVLRKDGSLADAGEIGLFGAKGPTITAGYWNDSDTTYRSLLGGYWLTGDVVFRDEEGNYFQVDRTADVIDTPNGPGYSVLMEEVLLSEVPEIVDCAVVAGSHEDHALPVAIVNSDADPARLLEAANEALRAAGHPELVLLEVATSEAPIPVGVTGKVLKRRLRERYSCLGELAADNGGAPIAFAAPLVHVAPTPVS
jgi:acyl-coenzyme A synthetase/AMP-(fatty) acid ligase